MWGVHACQQHGGTISTGGAPAELQCGHQHPFSPKQDDCGAAPHSAITASYVSSTGMSYCAIIASAQWLSVWTQPSCAAVQMYGVVCAKASFVLPPDAAAYATSCAVMAVSSLV